MRPTSFSLRYVPMIKFIGGRHPRPTHIDNSVKAHPQSQGIIPGGEGTVKISTFAANQIKHAPLPSKTQQKRSPSGGLTPSTKPFDFTSVNELPKRFQNAPFEDSEIEVINSGVGFI